MKKRLMIICIVLFVFLYLININLLFFGKPYYPVWNSFATSAPAALVSLIITDPFEIKIAHPLNQTYNFSIADNYTLDLNVSANFNPDSWSYDLWDMNNSIKVNDSIAFSPNTTFNAVRWENKLIVYASSGSETVNATVEFFINVPDAAPFFGYINDSMFVCEGNTLNYVFNVSDLEAEVLQLSLTPSDPFFLDTVFTSGAVTSFITLFSGLISDSDSTDGANGWRIYNEKIEVTDQTYSDTAYTNITAIRMNDAPVISPPIGVHTVQTRGDNSTFYHQVGAVDEEDGDQDSGNLGFNISFLNSGKLFNISNVGVMNFSPNENQTGVYNISVCVNDTGINNPYADISICGQDGGSMTTCENFSLTVTDANRAPTITYYSPSNLNFNAEGSDSLSFDIRSYDPDGTIPDTYWYVDGVLREYDAGSLNDSFTHSFGCGVTGNKVVKAEITDGLLNDSVTWYINLESEICVEDGGGGGGGGGGITCDENWVCGIWNVCQNTERSLETGLLSGDDYRIIQDRCTENEFYGEFCGVQIRECFDLNFCNRSYSKPDEFQSCYYTEDPNCNDRIKNCHDDACELLVDCGGPCSACPSCSDKIQNQKEEDVDCGGPCPWRCEVEEGLMKRFNMWSILLVLLLLLILIIFITKKVREIIEDRKKLKQQVK